MGHIAIKCPMKAEQVKKKKRFQAHAVEDNDQEDEVKAKENEDSCEVYVLISALAGSVSPGNDTWLVDSGASKHMTGYKDSLSCLVQIKESPHKVMIGDNFQYPIKGMGEASYKSESKNSMNMKDVLHVMGLKKNLLSISALDKKEFKFGGWRSSHVDKRKNYR